jgi:hypothetical protein
MGQAFHRKQMDVARGRTSGTGIKYSDDKQPVVRELTAEEIAARDAETQQRNELTAQRHMNIYATIDAVGGLLHAWKEGADYNDKRIANFPGWTTANYCALPVDAEVARYYVETIQLCREYTQYPITVVELDEVFKASSQRPVSTTKIVQEAAKIVHAVARICVNAEGIDTTRFIDLLTRRARSAKQNADLNSALAFAARKIAEMFQEGRTT